MNGDPNQVTIGYRRFKVVPEFKESAVNIGLKAVMSRFIKAQRIK